MSKEAASKFVQAILNDEELRQRTEKMKPEEIVPFAKEMGFEFTLDELKEVKEEDVELSPEELEAAAGGRGRYVIKDKSRDYVKSHCNGDPNGPLHNWVEIGHEERPVLWGIFGDYTKGYNLYKCTRCGATKEERV